MDRQMLDQLSTGRSRRDVQAIRDALSALSPGDAVRVVIRSPRYGLYAVDGAVRTGANGQMSVADTSLSAAGEIQGISVSHEDESATRPELPSSTAGLAHGAAVRVTFDEPAYGPFHVTGPLTAGDDAFLLVGSWIVVDGDRFAPRVVGVEVAGDLDVHPANVPPTRPSAEDPAVPVPGLTA
ncbi:hypothetical protein JOE38_002551 [Clavibacter michiganensis]|uniref:hypothetical protein n=1 Tax=Clavibacter michiganensis TaxID=28447 RepID=UPI001D581CDF|nr:hypothetical protein [Clavibacter michiganensis]MBM7412728.1 hypothetical protein [Clavibacter michiganensis]